MTIRRKSFSRLSAIAFGAALVGLPARAALAGSPDLTAEQADAKAQHYRDQAAYYKGFGGAAYKAGWVQTAEREAGKYTVLQQQLSEPAVAPAPKSPEEQHYSDLVARYRAAGGTYYKAGLIQSAEKEELESQPGDVPNAPPPTPTIGPAFCVDNKPVARMLACAEE